MYLATTNNYSEQKQKHANESNTVTGGDTHRS